MRFVLPTELALAFDDALWAMLAIIGISYLVRIFLEGTDDEDREWYVITFEPDEKERD